MSFSPIYAVQSVSFDTNLSAGLPGYATLQLTNGQKKSVHVIQSRLQPGKLIPDTPFDLYKTAIETKLNELKQNGDFQSPIIPTDSNQHSSAASSAFQMFASLTAAQNMANGQGNQTTNMMAVAGNRSSQDAVVIRAFDPNANAQMGMVGRGIVNGTTDLTHLAVSGVGGLGSSAQYALSSLGNGAGHLAQMGDHIGRDVVPLSTGAARGVEQAAADIIPDPRNIELALETDAAGLENVVDGAAKGTCCLIDCVLQLCCDD